MSVLGPLDSRIDAVKKISKGNPGAVDVLIKLLNRGDEGFIDLFHLDDLGIRGAGIWVAYKNHFGEDLEKLHEGIVNRDKAMVEAVKKSGYLEDGGLPVR